MLQFRIVCLYAMAERTDDGVQQVAPSLAHTTWIY